MKIESIVDVPWSIMQYLRPALRYNLSWNQSLVFFLSGRLRQVLLYIPENVADTKSIRARRF